MKRKGKKEVYLTFAAGVRNNRKTLGLSQAATALRLGICSRTVRRWERGLSLPVPKTLALLRSLGFVRQRDMIRLHRASIGLPADSSDQKFIDVFG